MSPGISDRAEVGRMNTAIDQDVGWTVFSGHRHQKEIPKTYAVHPNANVAVPAAPAERLWRTVRGAGAGLCVRPDGAP